MRGPSTKNQLKEKSLHAWIILSNTLHALFQSYSVKFRSSVSIFISNFSHELTVRLARSSRPGLLVRSLTRALGTFLASVAPWPACAGVSCGGRSTVAADRKQNGGSTPFGTAQRPSALRVASCIPAHARGTVAVARQARNVLPAADGPRHPRSVELTHSTKPQPV